MKRKILTALLVLNAMAAQAVNLTTTYAENFNGMGTSGTAAPSGWTFYPIAGGSTDWTNATGVVASAVGGGTANPTLIASTSTSVSSGTQGYNFALAASTSDRALTTSPTSVKGAALQLSVTNTSGGPLTGITVGYDTRRFMVASTANELPGFWLFYSLDSGTTWTNVSALNPSISTVPNTAGVTTTASTFVTFSSALANNGTVLFRWVDDNASQSSPDQITGLDNVTFSTTAPNAPPTVTLTSPASGSTATAPGSFTLTATASDDGSVTQVEFLRNGTVIETDTTAPYSFADSALASGNYSYTARATDNLGATATSTTVPVAVFTDAANTALLFDGVNDYVTMGAAPALATGGPPANGLTLECWFNKEGAGITSSSGSGGVTAVPLFGKGRGESEGSNVDCNYFFGITTAGILVADFETYPAAGLTAGQNYPITATNTPIVNNQWNHAAVTYDGATATWKMYLNGAEVGSAPAASGALPRYDSIQHFGIGSALNSTGVREGAFAGRIDEVRVWNYARSAAEIAAAKDTPITAPTAGLIGRYGLNEGTGTTTANSAGAPAGTLTNGPLWVDGAPLVVNDDPIISLTAPADNTTLTAPANVTMTATATDGDGTIAKVEFFVGATEVGEDTTEPYSHDLTGLAAGEYVLTAKATDNLGGFTTSSAVTLHVMPPTTTPPTVALTSPSDNANFINPATINLTATANDADGTVAKVEFFNGATKLGEDTTAPYNFDWTNVPVGDYTLTAKATDDQTAATTSAAVTVHVLINQTPTIGLVSPTDAIIGIGTGGTVALQASISDPEAQPLTVTFYGREKSPAPGPDFTLMTLPDTQFYSENNNNRLTQFTSQTNWIVANKTALNIAFVAHMGDMVNTATVIQEWLNADGAMDIIENPATTMLTHGIPWGGAPGNHDVQSGGNTNWNQYFGTARWAGRPYFQGNYGTNNDNNYQFFSASGLDFIIINLVYNANTAGDAGVFAWADALLKAHPNRRAIITSHWIVNTGNPATFGGHGQALYDSLKDNPNLFMMLCGHVHGEGRRSDTFEGRTVYSVLQDYQDRSGAPGGFGGGDGWLRYFVFSPANNAIYAKTYRTTADTFETDADSQFTLPYNMSGGSSSWVPLGTVNVTAGGTTATLDWTGLADLTEYEWYAAVSDGPNSVGSAVRTFTTAANTPPTVVLTSPAAASSVALPNAVNFAATASDANGSVAKVEFYAGATKVGEDTTAPYEFAWTPVSGAYTLTAVAQDNQGDRSTSDAVNITVTNPSNILPSVAVTSPANNATLEVSSLTLTANASDTDGVVSKVEFFSGATLLGEDSTAPYAFAWTGITPGTYAVTARATDNDGGVTTSAVVTVNLTVPGNFTGSLTENFDSMGEAGTTPPGTWTVKNGNSGTTKTTWLTDITANGVNSVAAMVNAATPLAVVTTPTVANNNGFNAARSTVDTGNRVLSTSPTGVAGVALQLQLNNGTGVPLSGLQISYDIVRYTSVATANELPGYWLFYSLDGGSTWTNVAALNPAISGGTGVVVPNTLGVTNVPLTSLSLNSPWAVNTPLLLRWVDDNADPTSPDQIIGLDNVAITLPPNTPPTVAITSPSAGATFDAPATINIAATASDTNGAITKVEFFNGANKLGEDTSAPFEFAWINVSSGTYTLTAVATDNASGATTSSPVGITVVAPVAGVIAFSEAVYTVYQGASVAALTLTRSGGTAPTSVTIQTDNGTASTLPPYTAALAGTDYTDLTGTATTVEFGLNEMSKTVNVTLAPKTGAALPNKRFTTTISAPSAGATLGSLSAATVQILANDTTLPTLTISSPLPGNVSLAWPVMVKGIAGDARGVAKVEVSLNGGSWETASFTAATAATAQPFSLPITPVDGWNIISVRVADLRGNSGTVAYSFHFTRRFVVAVSRQVPAEVVATPDSAGVVTLAATPITASSELTPTPANVDPKTFQIVPGAQVKLTATPKAGYVFSHWAGLPAGGAALGNVATFTMPAGDAGVTATFVANPFAAPAGASNVFYGLVSAAGATPASNATEGYLTGTMTPTSGSFSGKILIDGLTQSFVSTFYGDGSGLFTVGTVKQATLAFGGKTLALSFSGGAIQATLAHGAGSSGGTATRGIYSSTNKVTGPLLNSATKGFFTLGFPSKAQSPAVDAATYPQGDGYSTISLTDLGIATFTGVLADGTAVTGSFGLVTGNALPAFFQLPTPGAAATVKGGSLGGLLTFDAAQPNTDVSGTDLLWFRPVAVGTTAATNLYTEGWPAGIQVSAAGALYNAVTVQTSLGLGAPDAANGNAQLMLTDGKLTAAVIKTKFNITGNTVAKIPATDASYTLVLVPTTGGFSGTFTPNWTPLATAKPAFKGILIQKGLNQGGYGFFLSNATGDLDPESGGVTLGAQ